MRFFSDSAPTDPPTIIPSLAIWTALLAILLFGTLSLGFVTPQPMQYVVMGLAFLLAVAVTIVGLMSRAIIERSESFRGDLIPFTAICFSQVVMLLFFVVVAPYFLPVLWVSIVFFLWGLAFVVYALASAVPAVRVILMIGLFLTVPLSILAVHLYQQQQAARRNALEKRIIDLGRGARELQDSK